MVASVAVGVSAAAAATGPALVDVVVAKEGGFALNRSKIDCNGRGFVTGGGGGGGSVGWSSLLWAHGSEGAERLGFCAAVLK